MTGGMARTIDPRTRAPHPATCAPLTLNNPQQLTHAPNRTASSCTTQHACTYHIYAHIHQPTPAMDGPNQASPLRATYPMAPKPIKTTPGTTYTCPSTPHQTAPCKCTALYLSMRERTVVHSYVICPSDYHRGRRVRAIMREFTCRVPPQPSEMLPH